MSHRLGNQEAALRSLSISFSFSFYLSPMVRGQRNLGMWGWGQAQAVLQGAGMGAACPCQPHGTLLPAALLGFSSLRVRGPPVRHMVLKLAE